MFTRCAFFPKRQFHAFREGKPAREASDTEEEKRLVGVAARASRRVAARTVR